MSYANAVSRKSGDKDRRTVRLVKQRPNRVRGGMLVGVFIGLVVGVLIAFGVVWMLNRSPSPFQNKTEGAKGDKPAGSAANNQAGAPIPLPGKPGDKPRDKQRFEFYGILEGKNPQVPGAPAAAPGAAPTQQAPAAPGPAVVAPAAPPAVADPSKQPAELLYLQAGAFQKSADAEHLKAKLALQGLDVSIQEVSIPEKGTMQRVRVGPFRSPDEMNRIRTLLSNNGVQATVVKQKE